MFAVKELKTDRNGFLSFCFFVSMFISVWAVRTPHSMLGSDMLRFFLSGIFYVLLLFECIETLLVYQKGRINVLLLIIALFPVLYWIYIHVWSYEMESFAITSPIIAFVFALQNDIVKSKVFSMYKKMIVITSLIGIVCYCSYVLKLGVPYSIAPYYDGRPYQNYVNFFNISFLYINSTSIRVCGIFNEPGWLGTTIGLLLCYDEFNLKKKSNWILLVAGLLTYSLAFVVIVALGFIVRNVKKVKMWIPLAAMLIFIIVLLPRVNTNNQQLNKLISRIEFSSSGMKGDNRSSKSVDDLLYNTLNSSKCFFGYGDGYAEYYNGINEKKQILTIKTEIINLGILGTLLLYVLPACFLIQLSIGCKKGLIFILCFWISLYQRPWLYIVSNYMLLLSTLAYLKTNSISSNNTICKEGNNDETVIVFGETKRCLNTNVDNG